MIMINDEDEEEDISNKDNENNGDDLIMMLVVITKHLREHQHPGVIASLYLGKSAPPLNANCAITNLLASK